MDKGRMRSFWKFCDPGIPLGILYSSLILTGIAIALGLFAVSKNNRNNFVLTILLVEYIFIVIGSTVIFRNVIHTSFDPVQLTIFWTYFAVFNHVSGVSYWDIILNVALFLPFGFLITLRFQRLKVWQVLLVGLLFSVCIESLQYLYVKGVAQIDDVMHNSIGCILGAYLAKAVRYKTDCH